MLRCLALSIGHRNETAQICDAGTARIAKVNFCPSAASLQIVTCSGYRTAAFRFDIFVSFSRLSSFTARSKQGGQLPWQ